MLADLENHKLYLSVLFTPYYFEDRHVTNPWLEQFVTDIFQLEDYDDAIGVVEHVADTYENHEGLCLYDFVTNKDLREDFLRFDLKQLKIASIRPRPDNMDPE